MVSKVKPPAQLQERPAAKPRPKFEIREVKTSEELKGFFRVLTRAFKKKYGWDRHKIDELDNYFRNHRRFVVCLLEDEPGRVIGTGMIAESKWKETYAVARLSVDEEFRKMGIGSAIAARRLEEARKMGLKEIIGFCAESLLDFHAKFGWEAVENIGRQEGEKEDSYMIVKKLD